MMTMSTNEKKPLPQLKLDDVERAAGMQRTTREKKKKVTESRKLKRRTIGINDDLDRRLNRVAKLREISDGNEAPDIRDYFELGLELLLDELEKGAHHPEVAMLWERLCEKRRETLDAQFAHLRGTKTRR